MDATVRFIPSSEHFVAFMTWLQFILGSDQTHTCILPTHINKAFEIKLTFKKKEWFYNFLSK